MPGRLGGTPKVDLKRDPVPEPMGAVSPAPFYAIFGKNGAKTVFKKTFAKIVSSYHFKIMSLQV